jgi:hypothetical protein
LELQPHFYCLISKGAAGPMEGKKEATPSSKKLERNQTSESKYLSFLFVFFLLQISRDLHSRINALNLS